MKVSTNFFASPTEPAPTVTLAETGHVWVQFGDEEQGACWPSIACLRAWIHQLREALDVAQLDRLDRLPAEAVNHPSVVLSEDMRQALADRGRARQDGEL